MNGDNHPVGSPSGEAPHVPAAFINAIREEGTKAEACDWLQKTWNEKCALLDRIEQLEGALAPFAALSQRIDRDYADYAEHIMVFFELTHGDFRRARKTLSGEKKT